MRINATIFKSLVAGVLVIVLLHFLFHPVRLFGWQTSIFYLDERYTLGSYYTTVVYFLASFFAFLHTINVVKKRDKLLSASLGTFFFFLSFDEFFEIHEYLREVVNRALTPESYIEQLTRISWVLPFLLLIGMVFALLGYAVYTEKNRKIKNLLLIGIALYCFVLVLEVMGGMMFGYPIYIWFVGLEEGFEMLSAAVFLYAMMETNSIRA